MGDEKLSWVMVGLLKVAAGLFMIVAYYPSFEMMVFGGLLFLFGAILALINGKPSAAPVVQDDGHYTPVDFDEIIDEVQRIENER